MKAFSEKFIGFEDWKEQYGLSDNFLMSFGISNCIKPNPTKNKKKYQIKKNWEGHISNLISPFKPKVGVFKNHGQLFEYSINKTFIGYFDWAKKKKILKTTFSAKNYPFSGLRKSFVYGPDIEVDILENLRLLKIGGLKVIPDINGLIKPKYFEFVNAEYLELEGDLATSERQLIFEYSFIDNLSCENLDLALVQINNSNMLDAKINNSNISQWQFSGSEVSGTIINSKLWGIDITGGFFNVDFFDTSFSNVKARCSIKKEGSYEKIYRSFKQIYANQGADTIAINYYLREKQIKRIKLWRSLLKPNIRFWDKTNILKKAWDHFIYRGSKLINLSGHIINHLFWGYGRRPLRILLNA